MKSTGTMRRAFAGVGVGGTLLAGLAVAAGAAPAASAAPSDGCSASGIASTVSSVTGAARQYLDGHPDANQVVSAAMHQPYAQAEANLRSHFTANPSQYYELRGILAPIGDTQRTCGVNVLPGQLSTAYDVFMAG